MSDEVPEADDEFSASGDEFSASGDDSHHPGQPAEPGQPERAEQAERAESADEPDAEETFDASETDPFAGMSSLEDLVDDDLRKLAAERDEYLDALRRLQADFDNFRKRAMRQQTETLERAGEGLMKQLLPVLDALDLALAHEVDESESSASSLAQIGSLLRDTLTREGLERIDGVGVAFDPTIHDAVAHEAAEESAGPGEADGDSTEGAPAAGASGASVSEVLRAGYRLKGKVVRPAMVKVRG